MPIDFDYGLRNSRAKRVELAKYYYQSWRKALIDQFGKNGVYAVFTDINEPPVVFEERRDALRYINEGCIDINDLFLADCVGYDPPEIILT